MTTHFNRRSGTVAFAALFGCGLIGEAALAQGGDPDSRANATEAQMTDDERFGMIYSMLGAASSVGMTKAQGCRRGFR